MARIFFGTPQLGLIAAFIFGYNVYGPVWERDGPSLEEAAARGDPDAQYTLGFIEIFREGDEEVRLLAASARQGNADAQMMLGLRIALDGLHPEYAYMFMRLAQENGVADAKDSIIHLKRQMSQQQIDVGERLLSEWINSADGVKK
ncbi:MAG: hypothetical protein AAGI44_15230 [Pseudomonadota bacterium]